ncbi:unnamed protein product [Peniophora sp. CBMAI 1063]|nr:unnamed protein product [Peniophora sp. CBMAI 1063]
MSKKHLSKSAPRVRPLTWSKIGRAAKTQELAFAKNPMVLYLQEYAPPENPIMSRIMLYLHFIRQIDSGVALMVGNGDAVLLGIEPPSTSPPPSMLSKSILRFQQWYNKRLYSPANPRFPAEGRRRVLEYQKVVEKEESEALGDAKDGMWYVNLLATRPDKQGKGYASALMHHFGTLADETPIWLHSSDYANTGFYESLGYRVRAEAMLGVDNESWKHEPVHMTLMVKDRTDEKARYGLC